MNEKREFDKTDSQEIAGKIVNCSVINQHFCKLKRIFVLLTTRPHCVFADRLWCVYGGVSIIAAISSLLHTKGLRNSKFESDKTGAQCSQ